MELADSRTLANLKAALQRKAVTNRLYLWLARQADTEGRRDLARLFREVAEGETLHALGMMEHLRKSGDPITGGPMEGWESHLANAVDASRQEAEKLFPDWAEVARQEGFTDVAEWFDALSRAEANHADRFVRYKEALYGSD